MLTRLCMAPKRIARGTRKHTIQHARILDLEKNVLAITLCIPSQGKLCVEVPKGMLTLAVRKWPSYTCEVAEVGNFKISMQSNGLQDASTPGQASLTVSHQGPDEQASLPLCTLVMNEWHAMVLPLLHGVNVHNILSAAEHVWKKQCVLFETSCIGTLQLPKLPTSLATLDAQCLSPSSPPTPNTAYTRRLESFALPHKFRTLLQYNCKLVSLVQKACCDNKLSQSRGLVVNAAMAFNCDLKSKVWHEMILADTLEVVPIVNNLPCVQSTICTRLSVKTKSGIQKVPIYCANEEAIDILTHSIGRPANSRTTMFYFFSKNGIPVLLSTISDRQAIESAVANLTDSRSAYKINMLKPIHEASEAKDILLVLHAAMTITKTLPNSSASDLKQFTRKWLHQASAQMPVAQELFKQAASLQTCNCIAALMCVASDFSPVRASA